MQFLNRKQAGKLLSERLQQLPLHDPLVLALPRGGVPLGKEIAHALHAPLEVLVVRKIGAPGHQEFGIGAVTENNYYWIDPQSVGQTGADAHAVAQTLAEEKKEVQRRIQLYRNNRPLPPLQGRSIVVVDDGLATGVTARVACAYLKQRGAGEVILAVPIGSPRTAELLRQEIDQVICLAEPDLFYSVGQFYREFEQLEDEEVLELLKHTPAPSESPTQIQYVTLRDGPADFEGILALPEYPRGLVIFSHGSHSSRFSPRNQQVAKALNRANFATLLFDLLTPQEARHTQNVFNIPLLARRIEVATRWVRAQEHLYDLPIGYFGASTGAGAALWAAAKMGKKVSAVVSRGGRPDLAHERLKEVSAPTLLLVGSRDGTVVEMNRTALQKLPHAKLTIIPGATHLFGEPGSMEQVEKEACAWFQKYIGKGANHAVA